MEKITAKQERRASMTKQKRERLLGLFGRFDWSRDYDYKRERTRGDLFLTESRVWSRVRRR